MCLFKKQEGVTIILKKPIYLNSFANSYDLQKYIIKCLTKHYLFVKKM
jgi:hypothetical protein